MELEAVRLAGIETCGNLYLQKPFINCLVFIMNIVVHTRTQLFNMTTSYTK